MNHVLIVNQTTFQFHLEYMFLGTGNKQENFDFLFKGATKKRDPAETITTAFSKNQIEMLNDIIRIKNGDRIIFFVTGISKFYGVFKVIGDIFLDNQNFSHLHKSLGINLTNRFKIEPYKVYSEGLSEFNTLDELGLIKKPQELQWSLIYRKLKGNRGSTMIFDHEYNQIEDKLDKLNSSIVLKSTYYKFDIINKKIVVSTSSKSIKAIGSDIHNRKDIISKYENMCSTLLKNGKAFEHYLHGILINDFVTTNNLLSILGESNKPSYIGNEVGCGVGMQRIDSFVLVEDGNLLRLYLVEVKFDRPDVNSISKQLNRYISWIEDYIVPIYSSSFSKIELIPIIFAGEYKRSSLQVLLETNIKKMRLVNKRKNMKLGSIRYVTYDFSTSPFSFKILV